MPVSIAKRVCEVLVPELPKTDPLVVDDAPTNEISPRVKKIPDW